MNNFFNKIKKDIKKSTKNLQSPSIKNKRSGGGRSLGGSKPGTVFSISLSNPGPLGIEVERTSNGRGYAIISRVVPQSQGEIAGLQRGDVVCFPDSNGEEEIMFEQFLTMARSSTRPLAFDVRRVEKGGGAAKTAGQRTSAEAFVKRQAVIAAAEAREKNHKQKSRPLPNTGQLTAEEKKKIEKQKEEYARNNAEHMMKDKPLSDETRSAIEVAKLNEMRIASELGYNPYEQANMSSGQAKTAVVASTHGTMNASGGGGGGDNHNTNVPPAPIQAPTSNTTVTHGKTKSILPTIDPVFDDAFSIFVTSNTDKKKMAQSLNILRTLITNATTKGQQQPKDGNADEEEEESSNAKFRRVRLTNPKIKVAVADMSGAVEILMAVGFVLEEDQEKDETWLVYPFDVDGPSWMKKALETMERYRIQL